MPTSSPPPDGTPPPPARFYGVDDTVFEVTLHEPQGATPHVPERLVQDLWRTQRFDHTALVTTDGTRLTILDPGTLNTDSGPDFTGASLRLGDTACRGDVEIHTTSKGWLEHKHQHDARYNSVILHVTLHADLWTGGLLRADETPIPELVLHPILDTSLRRLLYQFYTRPAEEVLCATSWAHVPEAIRHAWVQALATERIEAKKERLAAAYLHTPNLEALLHERLFAGLGYAKNAEAMTALVRRLPLALVRRLNDPLDLEALHLGTAGLLPEPADLLQSDRATADYAMGLRDRFDRLQLQHEHPVMDRTTWRFFRMRPANFPPLRIVQGTVLLQPGGLLHTDPIGTLAEAVRADAPIKALDRVLCATPGPFWQTHIRLEKTTKPRNPSIGRSRRQALMANAVVPVLLLHAEQTNDLALEAAAKAVLRRLPPPQDAITRRFAALGTAPQNALLAQGVHQLYRTRCLETRCLTCPIGQFLLDRA